MNQNVVYVIIKWAKKEDKLKDYSQWLKRKNNNKRQKNKEYHSRTFRSRPENKEIKNQIMKQKIILELQNVKLLIWKLIQNFL